MNTFTKSADFSQALYESNVNYLAATIHVLEARGELNALEVSRACDVLQALPVDRIAALADAVMGQALILGVELEKITDEDYRPFAAWPRREKPVRAVSTGSLHLLLVD